MNPLTCEMCGSTNLVKEDGVFVCKSCGTKYSLEEAKKIMAGDTVTVTGSVKVDVSQELENLYVLARREWKARECSSAQKYYKQIILKKPHDWEAYFCSNIYFEWTDRRNFRSFRCWNGHIDQLSEMLQMCDESQIENAINLISEHFFYYKDEYYGYLWCQEADGECNAILWGKLIQPYNEKIAVDFWKGAIDCWRDSIGLYSCHGKFDHPKVIEYLKSHASYLTAIEKYHPGYCDETEKDVQGSADIAQKRNEEAQQKAAVVEERRRQMNADETRKRSIIKFVLESLCWSAVIYIVYLIFFK